MRIIARRCSCRVSVTNSLFTLADISRRHVSAILVARTCRRCRRQKFSLSLVNQTTPSRRVLWLLRQPSFFWARALYGTLYQLSSTPVLDETEIDKRYGRQPPRLAPPSRRQRSSSFPRPTRSHAHRCSRLTRQHGGEQSGLVTLTFDLLTLKVVSESRVTWATSVPILVFIGLSVLDLGLMYATDVRRQTDVRRASSLNAPYL